MKIRNYTNEQSNFKSLINHLQVFKDTMQIPHHRKSLIRLLIEACTLKKLIKSILIGFIFLQISFLLFSPMNINKNIENSETLDDLHRFDQISKDNLRRNIQYREKRLGERRIKSLNSDDYGVAKKVQFQKQVAKKSPGVYPSLKSHVSQHLHPAESSREVNDNVNKSKLPLCPKVPPNLVGRLEFRFNATPPTLEDTAAHNQNVQLGGFYQPPDCIPRSRIALIIPHRARELHLRALLWHLHPIFQRQQLYYKIYVVHQAGNLAFNKAKLMNIGYLEAMKEDDYDCVVFHDVDLLPEDDRLLYTCFNTPKHLSVAIDKYGYRLPYTSLFGGVTMLTMKQFRDVNGYSNMYWGWGGEDDDMFNRIFSRGFTIKRPPFHLARYKMSFHHRDKGNRLNLMRYEILSRSVSRIQDDGLNSVKYAINSIEETPIYTNITADVGTAVIQCKSYLSEWTCGFVMWMCEHLTLSCGMLQYNSTDDGTLALPLDMKP